MISDSAILSLVVALVITGILFYGSYWAFAIGRVRTSRLYKRQALSVGVVGVYYGILWIASPFTNQLSIHSEASFAISAIAFFVGAVLIFSWIDGSIRVARRSDPVRRDTFRWRKLRLVFWALIVFDVVVLATLFTSTELARQTLTLEENLPFLTLFLAIFFFASPALFVAARRSRDPTLHRNLVWFAFFVVFVLLYTEFGYLSFVLGVQGAGSGPYSLVTSIITVAITVLPIFGAYSLYRSARSLVPLRPLSESSK